MRATSRSLATLCGLAFLGLVVTEAAAEQHTPADWLQRMTSTMHHTNYAGVFVYRYGGNLEAMRIIHRSDDKGERERLVSLNGAAREIIRDNDQVTCILPDSHAVMVDRRQASNPLTDALPDDASALEPLYAMALSGRGRVAGRMAQRVTIRPRDAFRYGYRLWIGDKEGLLLRSDLVDGDGDPVEQVMFTDVHTPGTIPDDWLKPSMPGKEFTWYRPSKDKPSDDGDVSDSRWSVDGMPKGFKLVLYQRGGMPGLKSVVEHRLYSDGLASVSLYIEQNANTHRSFQGHSRMGAVNAFGRVISGHQVVVVGEVPAATVEAIGRGVRLEDAHQ